VVAAVALVPVNKPIGVPAVDPVDVGAEENVVDVEDACDVIGVLDDDGITSLVVSGICGDGAVVGEDSK